MPELSNRLWQLGDVSSTCLDARWETSAGRNDWASLKAGEDISEERRTRQVSERPPMQRTRNREI